MNKISLKDKFPDIIKTNDKSIVKSGKWNRINDRNKKKMKPMAIKHSRPNNISVFHKLRVHIQKLILNICPSEKKILKIFYIQRLL